MVFQIKTPILGFENIERVVLTQHDDMTATLTDEKNPDISFSLVNPYVLREYSFDVPDVLRILLEIDEKSPVYVYNIMVRQNPVEKSLVNFLAPLIFNEANGTMGQAVLSPREYPDFELCKTVEDFMQRD